MTKRTARTKLSKLEYEVKLVEKCLAGDNPAWAELQRDYGGVVAYHVQKLPRDEREDALSRVWLHLMDNDYRPLHAWEKRSSLGTWMDRVARNKVCDILRAKCKTPPVETFGNDADISDIPEMPSDYIEGFRRENMREVVSSALDSLEGRQKEVIVMKYFRGLKLREIAESLGAPLGTVQSDHSRGLKKLKVLLKEQIIEWGMNI